MHPEIEENMKEKLRLLVVDLISAVEKKMQLMMADHSAKGMLKSGNTIKKTMDYISEENKTLYKESINYLNESSLNYHPELEINVQKLVKEAHETYKNDVLVRFQKSTDVVGNPNLYQRMLPEIESSMASDLAKFQNELNLLLAKLKHANKATPLTIAMWAIEGILLLISVFIAGMWYKNPNGNYEPILVSLGCLMPLLAICMKVYYAKLKGRR